MELLVDFTDNMLFAPIRTYNAIILLGLGNRGHLDYVRVPRQEQLMELDNLLGRQATRVSYSLLDHDHRWVLSTKEEREIIECIEGQFLSIKACIRTGIATLRDDCYLIDQVENGRYYKLIDGTRYEIEAALLKPIYKISEIDASRPLAASRRYIIFPYVQVAGQRCRLLEETEFRQLYPGGYASLKAQNASSGKDNSESDENENNSANSQDAWKRREKKLKFSFKEQREFDTIDEEIEVLEQKIADLDSEMMKSATNSVKLGELMVKKDETEKALEEKMDRWVYLNDLNERILNGE